MRTKPLDEFPFPAKRYYPGDAIPKQVIHRYARAIAARFHPDAIILFGSHAYGTPHADSDVDLLVVMPARNQLDQAYKIRLALTAPFALDLIVRTPKEMAWRLEEGESFLTEIVSKGKVLYEKSDAGVGKKGRGRLSSHDGAAPAKASRSRRGLLPRPAVRRKVPQGTHGRGRTGHSQNA
jgi:uncharacterized protein